MFLIIQLFYIVSISDFPGLKRQLKIYWVTTEHKKIAEKTEKMQKAGTRNWPAQPAVRSSLDLKKKGLFYRAVEKISAENLCTSFVIDFHDKLFLIFMYIVCLAF